MERGGFPLRRLHDFPVQLRGGRLVEPRGVLQPGDAQGFEKPQGTHGHHFRGIFRNFERHRHVALRRKVVDLVGLDLPDDANQIGGIDHVAVVQDEVALGLMRVLVEMVDPFGVKRRSAALQAVNFISFGEKELGEVGSVLSGNPGDQRALGQTATSFSLPFPWSRLSAGHAGAFVPA